jgi:hypothetical protein
MKRKTYLLVSVALGKTYNDTVDTFSFSILCWQMFSMETPYQGYSVKMFEQKVIRGGTRPKIEDNKWSDAITGFLRDSFVDNPKRPRMSEVSEILRDEINKISDEEITDILDASRKSQLSAS